MVFLCFQGVQKLNIGLKWVKHEQLTQSADINMKTNIFFYIKANFFNFVFIYSSNEKVAFQHDTNNSGTSQDLKRQD